MRYKVLTIVIVFFFAGLTIDYTLAFYPCEIWDKVYYIWDKVKDILFFLALYQCFNDRRNEKILLAAIFMGFIRLIWQIIAKSDYSYANDPIMVTILFFINIFVIAYIISQETKTKKWPK